MISSVTLRVLAARRNATEGRPTHYRPLNLLPSGSTVNMLSRFPALLIPTSNLRVIAAVCVQLKAVCGRYPLYVVFYYLTRPRIRR